MSEQKLIAWRGNDEVVRLHIAPRPGETERCCSVLGCRVGGREGEFAYGQYSGFLLSRNDEPDPRAFWLVPV